MVAVLTEWLECVLLESLWRDPSAQLAPKMLFEFSFRDNAFVMNLGAFFGKKAAITARSD